MTINHVFIMVTRANLPQLRAFYRAALQPLGYTEMIRVRDDTLIGFGSDYPYLWLQAAPEGKQPIPTHIAFDAPTQAAVDDFHRLGISAGGKDNGPPGIRGQYSRQPYYAAYMHDMEGNNVEAVCVPK